MISGFVHLFIMSEFGWINEFGLVLPPLIHCSDITNKGNTGFFIQKEKENTGFYFDNMQSLRSQYKVP